MKNENTLRETKEKRQHSSTMLPYSYYECRIPEYFINVPMHWHKEFELNVVIKGKGSFVVNNEKYIASQGDILLLPPDTLHAVYPLENGELTYEALVFNKMMLGTESKDRSSTECIQPLLTGEYKLPHLLTKDVEGYEELLLCATDSIACAKKNRSLDDLLLKSLLLKFFWMLESREDLVKKGKREGKYGSVIRPALEYMNHNYSETVTVDYLAKLVNLSKSHFMSCFKKTVGIGAIEYLLHLRMRAAMELLTDSPYSVAEVAGRCGYNNLSNFNRHFKKIVGCTPAEYRKECEERV